MSEKPRVLLLIPHLGGGGSEQVALLLAQNLSAEKYELHLCTATRAEGLAPAPGPHVTWHRLEARRVRWAALGILRLVWRFRPAVIVCGMAHLNFLTLLLRPLFPSHTRIVIRQDTTVSTVLASEPVPWYSRLLYRALYRRADRVICQSMAMGEDLCREARVRKEEIAVLRNPVDVDAIRGAAAVEFHGAGPHIVAAGRLESEKGFGLLIEAFAVVRKQFPDSTLTIAGMGTLEGQLKLRCEGLGLSGAVSLPGHVDTLPALLNGASLYVLSSFREGMPNALLEAAAAGLPIVSTPASMGLVDLLRGQLGVWLTRNITAKALAESIASALEAIGTGKRFAHPWIEPFRLVNAIAAYEEVIDLMLGAWKP